MAERLTQADFVVVGGGIAGLRAAVELAEAGRVLVVTKQELTESNTQYAQGGIAVALSDEDEVGLHLQDTVDAGAGLVNVEAARVLVEEGPQRIEELIAWGTEFDRSGTKLTFTREAAHSRSRILHAHGDSTGREIGRALAARARASRNIEFSEFEFSADLLTYQGSVTGIELLDLAGKRRSVTARAVLLASGGAGQVFANTTNPAVATGDGIAMAHRAGAGLSDLEFFQFHPTALYLEGCPRFLLTEALRGEGAHLINSQDRRFMSDYHPNEDLAPRDVVARSIVRELQKQPPEAAAVYLDMRHLDGEYLKRRFPRVFSTCLQYKLDITRDRIPVRPAAHYLMGGVRTDLDGRSSVAGLFAAGEAACTGVHGANRLASNSLLEGLVFGARAARAMREQSHLQAAHSPVPCAERTAAPASASLAELQQLMWQHAGLMRDRAGLSTALYRILAVKETVNPRSRASYELLNIATVAELLCRAALAREESRGAHFRTDFPERDDARFAKHSIIRGDSVSFE